MALRDYLLTAAYYPLKIYKFFLKKIGRHQPARLRVLLYHDIAPNNEADFSMQLQWLSKTWEFVTPNTFSAMVDGLISVQRDSLLLTFDDGFISNRGVAERVLNPLGIRALFFIVSNFANLVHDDDWRRFVALNIEPGLRPEDIPDHRQNMSIDDLKFLNETGHSIGAHTANHMRLSNALSEHLEEEIIGSANILELQVGVKIEHFAYTFGDLASFTPLALAVSRSRFKYIHTGLRGVNFGLTPSWAIRRDSCSPTDSVYLLGALLEGGADILYMGSLKKYETWGGEDV